MKKRILSIALAVALVISTMTCLTLFSASADSFDFGSVAYENFENLTTAQASAYFSGSKDDSVTVGQAIVQTGENNTKGLQLTLNIPYAWAWVNYGTAKLQIPDNAIGIRVWYTINQDTNMRFMFKDQTEGAWTDIAFEGTKASKTLAIAGTYEKSVFFADTEYNSTHDYQLCVEAGATADGNPATLLTIDNITFITLENYENFDNLTDAQVLSYLSGSKDETVVVTQSLGDGAETGDKFYKISMNISYSWAWLNYGTAKLNIPAEAIGINVSYKINQDTNMRFMFRDQTEGAWTDIAFEGTKASKTLAAAGTYNKKVLFENTEYNSTHDYCLAIEAAATADGNPATEVEIYSIDFIRYGTSAAGNIAALEQQISAVKSTAEGDSSLYTADTWNAFITAYNNAKAVKNTATQRQMDQAASTLKSAYDSLEPSTTDKTALGRSIDTAKVVIDNSNASATYTESTLNALKTAYNNAKAVYDDSAALQSAINASASALDNAYSALKVKPAETEYIYDAVDDYTYLDFEEFENTLDMATLSYEAPNIIEIDNSGTLKQSLETENAISGDKSMKIAWNEISTSSTWPAIRFWGFNGTFRNQALYFDIVCQSNWSGVFVIYGNDNSGVPMEQYKYSLSLTGSDNVQHIKIPLNEFKNNTTGERWTKSEWNTVRSLSKGAILKIQIDSTGGLNDNSFMLIDNIMFVKADSEPQNTLSYNYTTYGGGSNPDQGGGGTTNPDQGGTTNPDRGSTPVDVITEGNGYYEIKKYDEAVSNVSLTSAEIDDLLKGNGIYVNVKADKDSVMDIKLSDGNIELVYKINVKGSESVQLINVDYTDFVSARGTFGELNFANTKLEIATSNAPAKINAVGTYNYAEIYAAMNAAEQNPDGQKSSEETYNSPKTGDNSNIVFAAIAAVIAIGALVVSKKFLFVK